LTLDSTTTGVVAKCSNLIYFSRDYIVADVIEKEDNSTRVLFILVVLVHTTGYVPEKPKGML